MRVTFALTSRLVMITTVCTVAIVVLLVMLGFELGLRHAHADFAAQAQARAHSQPVATDGHGTGDAAGERKDVLGYSPVAVPTPAAILYGATDPSKGR